MERYLENLQRQKKHKIRKPSGLSLNPLFKKECHLLSDKLDGFIIESLGGLNFH